MKSPMQKIVLRILLVVHLASKLQASVQDHLSKLNDLDSLFKQVIKSTGNNKCQYYLITYGSSGAGKSSSINTIAGEERVQVGDGRGYSTTKQIRSVNIQLPDCELNIQDSIGLNDNKHKLSNEKISELTIDFMLKADLDNARFALFHSLANDNSDIKHSLFELESVFGKEIRNSTIVLLTKGNMAGGFFDMRLQARAEECEQDLGLKWMLFDTEYLNEKFTDKQRKEQNNKLIEQLSKLKPYKPQKLVQIFEQLMSKAIIAQSKGPTKQVCYDKKLKSEDGVKDFIEYIKNIIVGGISGQLLELYIGLSGGMLSGGEWSVVFYTH
eukprot:403346313